MDVRRRISFNMNSGGGQPSEPSTGGTYTVNLNGQWEATTAVPNPDSTLYDGVYRSSSSYNVNNGVSTMYIDISGLSEFTLYIRSYAESSFDYVMVSELDKTITSGSSTTDTTLVKAHTKGNQKSGTTISDYTEVKYTNIDGGSHRITILYKKDSSVNSGDDRGYVLIKKQNANNGGGTPDNPGTGGDISGPINTDNYLTILALENGLTASLSKNACQYCIDGDGNWIDLPAGTTTQAINSGQTLSFRGNLTPKSSNGIGTFTISKKCNIEGNCMSLLFGDDAVNNNSLSGKNYAFYNLFSGCTSIIQVSESFLPTTTLANYCYQNMFNGCSSLTTAPELPATTLYDYCYRSMFSNCTRLTTAPELPVTTLANNCYQNMFNGCTSLTTAPALPATKLANRCYDSMFNGCTSLTTAPALPATTLANNCYYDMFEGCSSLTTAPELPATTLASYCYYDMFRGCTSLTVAPELPATTLAGGCYNSMFNGCSGLTTAPALLATKLADYCYTGMFEGCSSLTTAPELPATTLANRCYSSMFNGCSSLTTAPELPATKLADYCYQSMFNGCKGLTTAPELPATKLASGCYYYMFLGCSSLTVAPELPATTLASYCYGYMFNGCSSLTVAPELLATKLADYCYTGMFNGCTILNYIKMLATDISASNCLSNWVYDVLMTGTFVKHPNMSTLPSGSSGIPGGWTVYNNGSEPDNNITTTYLCDIAYWDGDNVKIVKGENWEKSLGTPIGVVVIPKDFAPDGKIRIVSCKSLEKRYNIGVLNNIPTKHERVPITDNKNEYATLTGFSGYLPTDYLSGETSFVDEKVKYKSSTSMIPSPYFNNNPNPEYYKTIPGNNCFGDFNGLINTKGLIESISGYHAANAAYEFSDGVSNQQWYLPSMGELGYLIVRLKMINNTLILLNGDVIPTNYTGTSNLCSSTIYNTQRYCSVDVYDGGMNSTYTSGDGIIRPFSLVDVVNTSD